MHTSDYMDIELCISLFYVENSIRINIKYEKKDTFSQKEKYTVFQNRKLFSIWIYLRIIWIKLAFLSLNTKNELS